MPKKTLKQNLSQLSKDQLIKHIIELNKRYKSVKEYHSIFFNQDIDTMIKKYKKQIENEFYPMRGNPKMRLSVARKAITEAKKLGLPAENMADLMLYYVETGVAFTNDYGDIDEPFYNSMESMFEKALVFMQKESVIDAFKQRIKTIAQNSEDTGWGFGDYINNLNYEFYGD